MPGHRFCRSSYFHLKMQPWRTLAILETILRYRRRFSHQNVTGSRRMACASCIAQVLCQPSRCDLSLAFFLEPIGLLLSLAPNAKTHLGHFPQKLKKHVSRVGKKEGVRIYLCKGIFRRPLEKGECFSAFAYLGRKRTKCNWRLRRGKERIDGF